MTQEDRELLLKDLCARLLYGVKCNVNFNQKICVLDVDLFHDALLESISVKPYLRLMSSMTEEERNEYFDFRNQELQRVAFAEIGRESAIAEVSDWLNAHYFDYRGLIEKGLALEAPEGMYNIN